MQDEHSIREDKPRRGNEHQLGLESLERRSGLLVSLRRARQSNSSIIVSLQGGVESVIC